MSKSAGPHHLLSKVRACLADTSRVMVARSTATQMIAAHFGWDYARCVAFAKEVVRGLTEENFYRRTTMADRTPADEYGVVREGNLVVREAVHQRKPGAAVDRIVPPSAVGHPDARRDRHLHPTRFEEAMKKVDSGVPCYFCGEGTIAPRNL